MATLVITMAGHGERFSRAGYNGPKWALPVAGRTLFDWSLASVSDYLGTLNLVIVGLRAQGITDWVSSHSHPAIRAAKLVELPGVTRGQAETVLSGLAHPSVRPEAPVIVYNIDTHVCANQKMLRSVVGQNWALCFRGVGEHWSFFDADSAGRVRSVSEKKRISELCSVGLYAFSSAEAFRAAYAETYPGDGSVSGEHFVAPLYGALVRSAAGVWADCVEANSVVPLGTPVEYENAARVLVGHSCGACALFDNRSSG
jgi:NDP-sugar pyrophosphorylase family protein